MTHRDRAGDPLGPRAGHGADSRGAAGDPWLLVESLGRPSLGVITKELWYYSASQAAASSPPSSAPATR